jgi:hypothetical protein
MPVAYRDTGTKNHKKGGNPLPPRTKREKMKKQGV